MNTYWRKMNGLSSGMDNNIAVNNLLKKKYPDWTSLHLFCLSIFKTKVLKLALAYLILRTGNLEHTNVTRNTGMTMEKTKMIYDAKVAIFLAWVVLLSSTNFMTEKKTRSKYESM